jgi:hypothetical protein
LQGKIDAKRLIFIDETWAKTNMTRTHGRCAVGARHAEIGTPSRFKPAVHHARNRRPVTLEIGT